MCQRNVGNVLMPLFAEAAAADGGNLLWRGNRDSTICVRHIRFSSLMYGNDCIVWGRQSFIRGLFWNKKKLAIFPISK